MALTGILETLEEQTKVYEQLLHSAKDKTPVLVNNDIDSLNTIIQKEKKLLLRADELEKTRLAHTYRYFHEIGYKSRLHNLTELIRSVYHPEDKQRLIEKQQQMSGMLKELQHINDLNQQLIAQSLAFINYSIDLVVEDPAEDVTYQHPHNKLGGSGRTGIFDTRA
ncbi:hypothetical protein BG53_00940 [Paenibacillus darwinianus]|uniref:Flagellar biosynthesis protein FlgN n=1 Tax=Paenibacillus darwinianus TaxID=1380763 RepID=A0A9W5S171_9BACL|nr:flagellar protein FlgN [Paenibacillus darwinianus]EXX88242.1 hypothetical protein CH50_03820 [Paenibacillus darwinianus]EXX89017.1 hypothetical protein BG53_00940 [Paenibacillus darwinianus]EXX89425.1 hypothetical protein BG52_15500 [Paenibacillus darwinianus]